MDPIVIVGSGMAGYGLAREIRKRDRTTPVLVLSRDDGGAYAKPNLSNALAAGRSPDQLLSTDAATTAAQFAIDVRPHVDVVAIDREHRRIRLTGGDIAYRELVLAVGAEPIRAPIAGDAADTVLTVNDRSDYARFRTALAGARHVTIIGAGLIGCEFANDLLARGVAPTVLDLADRPLSRLLPEGASARLRARLEAAGVAFRFGVGATRVDRAAAGLQLTLSDASTLICDLVLSAIGLRPRTAMAKEAGLHVSRGVVTDQWLATSAPHVYAVGDCADVVGHSLPYVLPIMAQARALGATLAGTPTKLIYPAMAVTVKTPACPTVVCPPPADAEGAWLVKTTDDACDARFIGPDGTLLGFALLGTATAQRQALVATVPALLPG